MRTSNIKSVDIKSLVIGLLLGVCVMLARGQTTSQNSGTTSNASTVPEYPQRYQISAVQEGGKTAVYVIDHRYEKVYRYSGSPWDSSDAFQVNH